MKKLLIALGALVLLVVAVIVVAPFLVPLDTYKAEAIARVKAATGRDLRIDGPIRFSVLPVLGIEASKVAFANAPGASTPEMLQLGKVEVALKLMPLLSGTVAVDRFVVTDPVIQLEIDKQGRPNWVFGDKPAAAAPGAAAPAAGAAPGKPAGAGARGLSELRLDDIRLVNGRVTWLDQRSGTKQELTDIAMKLALPSLEDALAAEGSVTWRGKPVRTVLNVAKPRAVMEGGTSGVAMKVTSEPVTFDYQGQVTNAAPVKVEGTIDLKIPSVRGLGTWVGSPVPGSGSTFGPLDIKGRLAMAGSRIGFTEASLAFDAIRGKGELAFDGAGAKPHLQAKLELEKLDMNPYLPAEKPGAAPAAAAPAAAAPAGTAPAPAGAPAAPARAAGWSDDPIDLSGLRAADADLSLSVGGLQVRRIQVGASALAVTLKDGRMTADLSRLALYQGNGQGRLALDGSGAVPGLDLAFKLAGLQAEPALRDAAGFDQITGTGNFDVAVNGRGKSQRELVGALNGRGDLRFANGALKGINLGAIAQAGRSLVSGNPAGLIQGIEGALKGGTGANQQTEFSSLTGTFVIANGIVKNSDLDLKSPVLHATGSGSADLPRRTADYRVVVAADTIQVPVLISGPWDNLSYKPDTQALMTQGGGQAIQNLINKAAPGVLPNAGGNKGAVPGDLLKGLFRNR